jgi:hypothetical protein
MKYTVVKINTQIVQKTEEVEFNYIVPKILPELTKVNRFHQNCKTLVIGESKEQKRNLIATLVNQTKYVNHKTHISDNKKFYEDNCGTFSYLKIPFWNYIKNENNKREWKLMILDCDPYLEIDERIRVELSTNQSKYHVWCVSSLKNISIPVKERVNTVHVFILKDVVNRKEVWDKFVYRISFEKFCEMLDSLEDDDALYVDMEGMEKDSTYYYKYQIKTSTTYSD